jgi:uncharacterized protein
VKRLEEILAGMEGVVVAYSGGVDSAFVAWAGRRVLGDRCLPVIADSASLPRSELNLALENARRMGFSARVIRTHEQENPDYLKNEPNRCFFCKSELFSRLCFLARAEGYPFVACGDNLDDREEDRPGMKAARDLGVRSPLREAGLGEESIRALAREHGLPVWDKPATACLASRIPHGTLITLENLAQVERAEDLLRAEGFRQIRVRHRGSKALIQVGPDEVPRLGEAGLRAKVSAGIRGLGFAEVEVDPAGYSRS